ncbi:protein lethal(2)essential for life-like protein [Dinothrombium tinctorium]|uniref:Protein lethal(2)essential for life-like protein n=1 Tax=Dinothrombium tinctorium TaxID=1965070 RepID=A0A3S3R2K1_9ACAR|nr:protein lethal(2)essential for life-like protein [Dinothrombium tinctorium]
MALLRSGLFPVLRPTTDYWDLFDFPERLFDQHFGLGIADDELFPASFYSPHPRAHRHLMRHLANEANKALSTGISEVKNEKDQFRVQLDVSHFKPEELKVKTVDGNSIVIEGKHEEQKDEHGFISRQFTRRYMLPRDIEHEKIVSSLTPDGMLVITAPKKVTEPVEANVKNIPIEVGKEQTKAVDNK